MRQFDTVYDAAVFGNGLCGFAAAMALAERGARVLLAGRRPVLGWEATWALQLDLDGASSRIGRRIVEELSKVNGWKGGRADACILQMALDRMAADAGVELLYYAQPVALSVADAGAAGVVVAGKSGHHTVRAKAYVDATESGLLWDMAGAGPARPPETEATFALQLSRVEPLEERVYLGDLGDARDVTVKPNVWPGEVMVEFDSPTCDVRAARRALPGVLAAVRERLPGLAGGVVTNVAVEPFPLHTASARRRQPAHPELENLFSAGPWLASSARRLDERLSAGDNAGEFAARRLPSLKMVEAEASAHAAVAPPAYECDVVVCGGGTAGAIAAIAAARLGARTALIEPTTFLGGIGTGGGIHSYYHGVPGGIQDEVDERVAEMTPLFAPEGSCAGFNPFAKQVVLQQMSDEAGVDLVFQTTVTGVESEPAAASLPAAPGQKTPVLVTGVVTAGPAGGALYKAKVVVDSTGDGDVAVMAGADCTFGRDTDGLPHAYSLAAGRLDANGRLTLTNFDAGYCDPTDLTDLTRAQRRALSHYWNKSFSPDRRLTYIAPLLGLRNSRQIIGDYRLTLADEIRGRQFPDVIAYAYSHFDNHGFDYENESDEAMWWVWTLGNWRRKFGCEIPYRCLLPRGVEGLLVACRAISITHDAHNQLRMQRDMQRIGEAAGAAAALAVQQGVTPRALDVAHVQEALLKTGALGPRERKALPAPTEETLHEASWIPAQPPAMPLEECVEKLDSEDAPEAAWQLVNAGSDGLPALKEALKSESPRRRLWASLALAMLRDADAAPELIACVEARNDETPEGHKAAPVWKSAIVLLGRLGAKEAVPALTNVLAAEDADFDTKIAAIRSLGRIGDPGAAQAIEALVDRKDLNAVREFQVSVGGVQSVKEDARWQVDLAAAEALWKLGRARPDLAERHREDERAYVRRYAERIAREMASAGEG